MSHRLVAFQQWKVIRNIDDRVDQTLHLGRRVQCTGGHADNRNPVRHRRVHYRIDDDIMFIHQHTNDGQRQRTFGEDRSHCTFRVADIKPAFSQARSQHFDVFPKLLSPFWHRLHQL